MSNFEFHFDFASPNSYFSHRVVAKIVERTGVACSYIPVLLGGVFKLTNNKSPMEQFAGIKNKNEYNRLEMERFIAKHQLDKFQRNPHFPVNTVKIMRGAIYAAHQGEAEAYIEAIFHHMWEAPKKMDDADVMAAALAASGFAADGYMAAINEQPIKDELLANTTASVERGAFGSPTFFVGDEMFFGKDRLRDVEEEIEKQK
jgi:2-hydroxychromene-2-carboxylate isomerase